MNYEIVDIEFMGEISRHVVITRDDGSMESFPVDDENPRYLAWVSEGNTAEVIEG